MNSKEALERILNSPITKEAKGCFMEIEELKEIKQDLDKLEKLEKAIEILKDKLNIDILTNGNVGNYYKYYLDFQNSTNIRTLVSITQEQYELLKEVLKNV